MPGMSMGSPLPPLTALRAFSMWSFHPWSAVILTVVLAAYLSGWRRGRRLGATLPFGYLASWLGGAAVLVFATQGSPAVYGDDLFWIHMVAHLLLIMVAPVMLVAGHPLTVTLAACSPARRGRVEQVFRGRMLGAITNPAVGIVVYTAVIAATHLTGFMNTMMLHPWLHGLEQLVYVLAGVLFFLPLIGEQPIRWQPTGPLRMGILVMAMPVDTFTGVILGQTTQYPWPAMAAMHPAWGPSLLTDLHAGGAVMWIGGDAIMSVMIGGAAIGWARAAAAGDGSELGGWLNAARLSYQRDLLGADGADVESSDSDEALAAYNTYLQRLHAESDPTARGRAN